MSIVIAYTAAYFDAGFVAWAYKQNLILDEFSIYCRKSGRSCMEI
jgi:hypothetical protein